LAAIASYEKLMAAKKKEILALTKEIETKLTRIGDLGVEIAQMKNDLGDTDAALIADKKFLANLDENCDKKKKKRVGSDCEDPSRRAGCIGRHHQSVE
jgi:hypothetical protein